MPGGGEAHRVMHPLPTALAVSGALIGVLVLGTVSQIGGAIALIVGGALAVVDVVLLRWHRFGRSTPAFPADRIDDRIISVIAASWVVAGLLPMHDIGRQSARAAVSALTLQTGLELLLYGAAGAVAFVLLLTVVPWRPVGAPITLIPVWVLASAAWAAAPAYAIARGAEYVTLLLLAVVTAGIGVRSRHALDQLLGLVLRWLVLGTLALMAAGVAIGPMFVVVTAANRDRFTWIGAHPTESGFMLGIALLVLLATDARTLRVPEWFRVGAAVAVAVALYENQTRTVLAGVVVAGLSLLVLWVRRGSGVAWFATYATGALGVVAALFVGGAISSYILRGGDVSRLTTLNGRTDLWEVGLAALTGPTDWLVGLGYGATRTVFIGEFAFAGNAHSSLLGTLVGLGLIGAALLLAALVRAGHLLLSNGLLRSDAGRALLAMFLFSVVGAVSSDGLAEPHLALTVLFLVTGAAQGWRATPMTLASEHAAEVAGLRGDVVDVRG